MNTTRKLSQELQQFAIFVFLSTFIVTVAARVFVAENIALSAEVAVLVLCAFIVAERWREW